MADAPDPVAKPGPATDTDSLVRHYDASYAAGGFGYRERRPHWVDWSRRHYVEEFDLQPGDRVLDVGCGDGFWTGIFAELGLQATGVDISPGGIAVARAQQPGLRFEVADADRELPFPNASFDVVFCRAISHLSRRDLLCEENRRLIERLVALLAPGGLLLVSYSTKRDGGGTESHVWHRASDLVRLLEVAGDPCHLALVGDMLQIGAQRRDAPRRPRAAAHRDPRPPSLARRIGRRLRSALRRVGGLVGR
jgi:SAM-dependent methyltransferase